VVSFILGWNEGSANFNSIISSAANMQKFCQSAIDTARANNLDGLDIDWYYILDF
jgi:GH18 family chitinase